MMSAPRRFSTSLMGADLNTHATPIDGKEQWHENHITEQLNLI